MIHIGKFPKSEPYSFKFFLLSMSIFALFFLIWIKFSFNFALIFFFIVFIGSIVGLYFLTEPSIGVGLMVLATSLDVIGRLTPESAVTITFFHLIIILTIVCFLLKRMYLGQNNFETTKFDRLLLSLIILIGISLFYSPNREEGFVYWFRVIALIIVMYLTMNVVDSKRGLKLFIVFTFLASLSLSFYATYQLLTTSSTSITTALLSFKLFRRFGTTFENPNYFAAFLLLPLMLGSAFMLFQKLTLKKKLLLIGVPLGVILVAFIGTFSRSAWISFLFGVFFLMWFSKYRRTLFIVTIIIFILLISLFYQTPILQSFLFRFTSIFKASADPSNMTRIFLINGGIQMALDSHLIGVGFRGFPIIYKTMYMPHNQVLTTVYESHTSPIEILAELGIIGFSLFVIIFYKYFSFGFNSIQTINDNFLKTCQIGVVGFVFCLTINYLFGGGILEDNLLWICIGLTFAIDNLSYTMNHSTVE